MNETLAEYLRILGMVRRVSEYYLEQGQYYIDTSFTDSYITIKWQNDYGDKSRTVVERYLWDGVFESADWEAKRQMAQEQLREEESREEFKRIMGHYVGEEND
jgi:hypothetical protein